VSLVSTAGTGSGAGAGGGPPGTPRLLREINVRAAFALLVERGPMSRTELAALTGLSKVTAGQLLARLGELGVVEVVGTRAGGRGPNADVHGVVAAAGHVVGVQVDSDLVTAATCDLLANPGPSIELSASESGLADDPVALVRTAVARAVDAAGVPEDSVRAVVVGIAGIVDPRTGDVAFSYDHPQWGAGVRAALERELGRPVTVDNDVNLLAIAEQREGVAVGEQDFVYLWVGGGVGCAIVLSGAVRRGTTGAAGEVGYLPVPGVAAPGHIGRRDKGGFQKLVAEEAVLALARERGYDATSLATAVASGGRPFVEELAARLALGVAAVAVVVDPRLVVLAGPLAEAAGAELCDLVARDAAAVAPMQARVVAGRVPSLGVMRGAHLVGLETARELLLSG
jgi:predicted NBD/HSP70 family sugar kinase